MGSAAVSAEVDPVPFTEDELRAARQQMQMRDFATALDGFMTAWRESVAAEFARLAEARRLAAERAAARKKRIDAAELYLRRQSRPSVVGEVKEVDGG